MRLIKHEQFDLYDFKFLLSGIYTLVINVYKLLQGCPQCF
jgi:hypothetical protein